MSSLSRYKKSGGFYQLLSLIETFGPQKREKFLEMIEGESPAWANALRDKMLTVDRIFQWDVDTVVGIIKRMPIKSQALALSGLKDDYKAKISPYFSTSEQRKLADVLSESAPKPEEVQATLFKIVDVARKLLQDRELSAERLDAGLVIPEDIEARLENAPVEKPSAPSLKVVQQASNNPSHSNSNAGEQTVTIPAAAMAEIQHVLRDNKALRDEVKLLREKLEAIRKIA